MISKRQTKYAPTNMRQSGYEQHLTVYGKGIFKILPFFKMRQNSKLPRGSYKNYFTDLNTN